MLNFHEKKKQDKHPNPHNVNHDFIMKGMGIIPYPFREEKNLSLWNFFLEDSIYFLL